MKNKEIAQALTAAFKSGHKLLVIGNGGSAAEATHLVGECLGKFERDGKPLPAISLFDLSALTAIANDYGYNQAFSRQVWALGNKGDVLITLSTSGESENIINAQQIALLKGIKVIAFPTNKELKLKTAKTQEKHLEMIHKIMRKVEKECR